MNYATTQRRVSLAALAALMVFVPLTSGGAGAAGEAGSEAPSIYEARAEAAAFANGFVVPAQIDTFTPYSLSETASGSSHGLQAVFYPGFLLSAAAFQQGFPPPPGTTETLYPQGPTDGKSQVLPIPGFPAGSSGSSGPAASRGEAHYGMGGSDDSGGTFGLSKTSVSAETATVRSVADVVLNQVRLGGGLFIGSVVASAEATADGTAGGAANTGSVTLNGLTLSGVPLTLRPDTLQAGQQKGDAEPRRCEPGAGIGRHLDPAAARHAGHLGRRHREPPRPRRLRDPYRPARPRVPRPLHPRPSLRPGPGRAERLLT